MRSLSARILERFHDSRVFSISIRANSLSFSFFPSETSMRQLVHTRFHLLVQLKWNRKKPITFLTLSWLATEWIRSIKSRRNGNKRGRKSAKFIKPHNPFHCFPSLPSVVRNGRDGKEGGCSYANSLRGRKESLSMSGRMVGGQKVFEYRNRVLRRRISRKRKGRRLKQFSHGLEWWIRRPVRREYQGISEISRLCSLERTNVRSRWRMGLSREGREVVGGFCLQGQLRRKMDAFMGIEGWWVLLDEGFAC